ncbi:DUF1292 domain-containing protein [Paenibacillus thiaminolyticus]|uniref:DUF1292 domain-containing protein n=1 Tax=Paenibacillus thiaminolyticus TaxID=49283 RepID=A0AAP9DXV6_PANTH|nr:DUF1292 domain-containing protein [Paenibacillus thiaminolyticus]MCY9535388.1 DUF1292 domain-containing protein [Paenibacillus thiaminolyticus]MCY9603335.1 DUF1292 domain-containing protein [Paenibacillus thiaminolyticus]MCY9607422.1 DUF1292 domain-containing protein [Paenibacillus thiaminolyticus]MCY9616480.1 DUF1292 domain-containing protein [Paenibacillus thiaminolyticus]MCY9621236.1 DUF1292 domain-containing protein [Paenibacillus thiaminolyticus]
MSTDEGIRFIERLKSVYGDAVEMTDERGKSRTWSLVAEFEYRGRAYAVLQPGEGPDVAEPDLFRIVPEGDNGWQLETIDDDEEWEDVMERYDEIAFADQF